jgi:hypothetical protein
MMPEKMTMEELQRRVKDLRDRMVMFGMIKASDAVIMVSQKTLEDAGIEKNSVLHLPFGIDFILSDKVPPGELIIISRKDLRRSPVETLPPFIIPEGPVHDLTERKKKIL